jgi:NodT family efflux transporter outer membrane factor (OMF) lipoprotein
MTRRLAILSFAVLLAGCVPGGIVPRQTEISGTSVGLGNAPAPAIDKGWWTAFADPGLDSLMTEALKGNPGLGKAMARLRAAKAGVEAANATLYPRLDFNGQEQRDRFSDIYIYPPPYAGSYRWIGTIEGDLSWNIDFWGKQAAQLDKAKALQTASRMDVEAARLALSSAVFQAYVDLDRAYKLADIAAQTERERSDTLGLTERRVRDGLDSKVEEQEAIALAAQARQARVSADSDRDVVVHELAALAGHGADIYASIVRPTLNLRAALPLPATLPADLLSRRPDIIAGQARIYAALEGRKAAKAAFYPDVDLLASVGWAAIGLGPLFQARSLQYGGGPAVHLPLFDAGALRAQYAGAVADIDSAIADYNGTLVNAVRETSDALTRIRSLNDQLAEEHRLLGAAESGYRLAATRYRSGLTTQLTVLDAQNILFEARQGDVSLKAQQVVQRVTLLVAVGGGFQAPTPTETSSR